MDTPFFGYMDTWILWISNLYIIQIMDSLSIGIQILLDTGKINKILQNKATFFVIRQKNDSLSISIQISMDSWIFQIT